VIVVKWFLFVLAGFISSTLILRADPAGDLYNKGVAAFQSGDYATAAQSFDQVVQGYPNTPNIDNVRLSAGMAYFYLGNYSTAVDRLALDLNPNSPARASALFYTGLAQLSQANKLTGAARDQMCANSSATLRQLIDFIAQKPTPANRDFLEDASYNLARAYFYGNRPDDAEKTLLQLLQNFNTSLMTPDYLLLLGDLYAREAGDALNAKQPADVVQSLADKALQRFDQVSRDPNALVQANEARLQAAEVLFLTAAQQMPSTAGYEKALDAFRTVKRKEDLIPAEQARLDALRAASQTQVQNSDLARAGQNTRLIEREVSRLAELKNEPDPVIQALIRIAECYNAMSQGNEARTVLHRLAQAPLTKDQQQDVDYALIYSYILGHQTEKANQALTDYLAKHPGDPQAESLSVQMGDDLIKRGDFAGALAQAQRSIQDFPHGKYLPEAIQLEANALTGLKRFDEAKKVENDFLTQNPQSPVALGVLLGRAQGEVAQGQLQDALADYQKVMAGNAPPDSKAAADAGYIQTLQTLGRTDDVIRESKAFAAAYPNNPALPNVLVLGAIASNQKHDPAAIAALQDVARRFPTDSPTSPAPFALFYVVNIYQQQGKYPEMIQAAQDLQKAFPQRYNLILQAANLVSAVDIKQKKFDDAIAAYQPLAQATDPSVAAEAGDKIGGIWLAAAKAMGPYQSMQQEADRTEDQKRLANAEQAYLGVLKNYPQQVQGIDDAFRGLDDLLVQRRSAGLLKDADFEPYFTKLTADLTSPEMQTRLELAKAGLVFLIKDGAKQYPAALARFRAAISANPSLPLTRMESDRYGELLLAAKDYPTALQVYTALLQSNPKDPSTQADGDYGLGATYLAQGDLANASLYFKRMKALPGGAAWHPHIADANYGLAYAEEQSNDPAQLTAAQQTYAALMQNTQASFSLQAKAMLGYGRILQKLGHVTTPLAPGTNESAVHYFEQIDTLYGPAVPEISAEGLYDAGQAYASAGDKAGALHAYTTLIMNYSATAPDWAAKATTAKAGGG
jgi:tetratricopeptide (TPR) repeat protein